MSFFSAGNLQEDIFHPPLSNQQQAYRLCSATLYVDSPLKTQTLPAWAYLSVASISVCPPVCLYPRNFIFASTSSFHVNGTCSNSDSSYLFG